MNILLSNREPQGIVASCNPVPPLVRQNLHDMYATIKEARQQALIKVM